MNNNFQTTQLLKNLWKLCFLYTYWFFFNNVYKFISYNFSRLGNTKTASSSPLLFVVCGVMDKLAFKTICEIVDVRLNLNPNKMYYYYYLALIAHHLFFYPLSLPWNSEAGKCIVAEMSKVGLLKERKMRLTVEE